MAGLCIDCGVPVTKQSLRCRSCRTKKQWEIGALRPHPMPLQPSEIREMAEIECAWVGALIEGEGHIAKNQAHVSVAMTEIEPIATLLRLTGAGTIMYQEKNGGDPRYKPIWWWELHRKLSILALLEQISPYLASTQEHAQRVIATLRAEVG